MVTVWLVLWGGGIVAFLAWFGRRYPLLLATALATVAAFIGSVAVQAALQDRPAYEYVMLTASRIGHLVVVGAVAVFVVDMAAMAVYTIRHATAGRQKDGIVRRDLWISMRSLADGTATAAERWMVVGIVTAMTSFLLIFVGTALILAKRMLFGAVLAAVPSIWFCRFATSAVRTWRNSRPPGR